MYFPNLTHRERPPHASDELSKEKSNLKKENERANKLSKMLSKERPFLKNLNSDSGAFLLNTLYTYYSLKWDSSSEADFGNHDRKISRQFAEAENQRAADDSEKEGRSKAHKRRLEEVCRVSLEFVQNHVVERVKRSVSDALFSARFLQIMALLGSSSIQDFFGLIGR